MNEIEKNGVMPNSKALEVAFFLGAMSMVDILFRDEISDEKTHMRYVLDLCDSNAPGLPLPEAVELVISRLDGPSRRWVNDWYVRRCAMS